MTVSAKRFLVPALLLVLTLMSSAVAQIEDLYRVSVPAASQGPEDRAAAFRGALDRVVVRLTGREDAVAAIAEAGLPARAERFVREYRYESDGAETQLAVRFDGAALREALVRAGIPVWQRDRPPVLVWLAVDGADGRFLVGDEEPVTREALRESMAERGVPLLFPLLDLEDQQRLSISDVAGGFTGPILEASERYGAAVVLSGSVRADGNLSRGRWTLSVDGRGQEWRDLAPTREELFAGVAAEVASRLQAEYALLPAVDQDIAFHLWLLGVDSAPRFAAAERALLATAGVEDVRAQTVFPDRVRFRLSLSVSVERMQRELRRSSALTPASDDAVALPVDDGGVGQPVTDPVYRLGR